MKKLFITSALAIFAMNGEFPTKEQAETTMKTMKVCN